MINTNSNMDSTRAEVEAKATSASSNNKETGSKIGLLIVALGVFAFVQFFLMDLKTDIYGEIYARFFANDTVDAQVNIDKVVEVSKQKKRGRNSTSYIADISYKVDGKEYHRSIPGIDSMKEIKNLNYKYSKSFPSFGYTEASTFSFYFDLIFLTASYIFLIVSLTIFMFNRIRAKKLIKDNLVTNS